MRLTALALGYNLNFAIFGGTAPILATWLISVAGEKASPAWYLMAVASVSIAIAVMMPETCDRTLTLEGLYGVIIGQETRPVLQHLRPTLLIHTVCCQAVDWTTINWRQLMSKSHWQSDLQPI